MVQVEKVIRHGIVLDPKEDGVTHINVYTGGQTRVGRELSNLYNYAPTDSPRLILRPTGELAPIGHFKTLEGFWWWLSTGMTEDYFRTCDGFDARKRGMKMSRVDLSSFKHEIRYAIALKLKSYPEILNRLLNTSLPLTHYYVYGKHSANPAIRPADRSKWVIVFLDEIRSGGEEVINKVLT